MNFSGGVRLFGLIKAQFSEAKGLISGEQIFIT